MATKRAKKKAPPQRKSTRSKNNRGGSSIARFMRQCLILGIVVLLALAAAYQFGPTKVRHSITHTAAWAIEGFSALPFMPESGSELLNKAYDSLPNSNGLIVDSGEIGHDGGLLLAGVPEHNKPLQVLHNQSYINLFNESDRQSRCVSIHIAQPKRSNAPPPQQYFKDPRIIPLQAAGMQLKNGGAKPIIPAQLMGQIAGATGAKEACLTSHLVPMSSEFEQGVWSELMELLGLKYPQRFGEMWIYAGPILHNSGARTSSGIPIPGGFYAIAFNLDKNGGLRAISFIVPHEGAQAELASCISSIQQIEQLTGLNFLPELNYDAREPLRNWVSPSLW